MRVRPHASEVFGRAHGSTWYGNRARCLCRGPAVRDGRGSGHVARLPMVVSPDHAACLHRSYPLPYPFGTVAGIGRSLPATSSYRISWWPRRHRGGRVLAGSVRSKAGRRGFPETNSDSTASCLASDELASDDLASDDLASDDPGFGASAGGQDTRALDAMDRWKPASTIRAVGSPRGFRMRARKGVRDGREGNTVGFRSCRFLPPVGLPSDRGCHERL